jgi:hypothetical protein
VCELDAGMGAGASFPSMNRCRELVLVDFSEAIYVARQNLRDASICLFLKGGHHTLALC